MDRRGLQQRFEESAIGRGVLSMLIVAALISIVAINLPGSQLRTDLLKPAQPLLNATGLDQNWALFAPDPRRAVIDVSAVVTFSHGSPAIWRFPHDGSVVGTYRDYRWRKWEENLIDPANAGLWQPAAAWAAAREASPGRVPRAVSLVERYAALEPPGVTPSTGPVQQRVIYTLQLTPPSTRSGSGGAVPTGRTTTSRTGHRR